MSGRVSAPDWQAEKAALLARLGEPGFWDDEGRFAVLGGVELRDRIEAGLRSAGSLMRRIRNARRPPAALVRRAAQRLILLDAALEALAAGEPADARLRVEGDPEFGPRLAAMYRAWAHERGMRLEVAEERAGRRFRWTASVTGFAALRTLVPEAGFHVLEIPDGRGGYDRRRVRVTVTPLDADPAPAGRAAIVRRYRERPTPLVRDAVRGWRTGKLDTVLAGGFDLVDESHAAARRASRTRGASPARPAAPRAARAPSSARRRRARASPARRPSRRSAMSRPRARRPSAAPAARRARPPSPRGRSRPALASGASPTQTARPSGNRLPSPRPITASPANTVTALPAGHSSAKPAALTTSAPASSRRSLMRRVSRLPIARPATTPPK